MQYAAGTVADAQSRTCPAPYTAETVAEAQGPPCPAPVSKAPGGASGQAEEAVGVLIRAHKRMVAAGGELRLLLPGHGIVPRLLAVTGLGRTIPVFTSMEHVLHPDLVKSGCRR